MYVWHGTGAGAGEQRSGAATELSTALAWPVVSVVNIWWGRAQCVPFKILATTSVLLNFRPPPELSPPTI